ncbi:cupin domain-containing protein [Ponticaulis sp.]|uniref:cupin domain-containing protein n=1 Tax=Ponticaulis sp. TaxID=2020902 RepID=UPI000B6F8B10|nr:cupin domain-containing protein [Ponticaulis sp.]MAI89818.1 hypothetical protein [Ponticaulis sp.]OUX99494.1 MAG: hypothetical protein CBB65_05205 [Hyphomonadaceae bacterium TMED5]|tara:strand:- start:52153 stop:52782 length:630 start_codon:yes stop_codon:yes gene_type:complete
MIRSLYICSAISAASLFAACSQADTPADHSAPAAPETQTEYFPQIISPDEARVVPFPGHDTTILAEAGDAASELSITSLIVHPRTMGAPPHQHANEDEYFIVLEGGVSFLNGEDVVHATPGTIAILPRGHWHGFWNANEEEAHLMLIVAPGEFGSFFDEVVMNIREENADSPQRIGAIIAETAATRNVTVDMSRLPAEAAALLGPPPAE